MKKDRMSATEYLRAFDRVSRMKMSRDATEREDSLSATSH